MKKSTTISVRLSPAECAWLALRKFENRSSVNIEIVKAVRNAMKEEPIEIIVHECRIPNGMLFSVSIGVAGNDFYEGEDRETAFAAARAKAKELGLSVKTIRMNNESFNQ